jgi:uncharacterized protein YbjT (DUF2867 family)
MFLVAGATGNAGGEVVRALAAAGEPVRALVRDPAKAAFPDGVEVVTGDLNRPETLTEARQGVRGAFLLSGYQDMPGLLAGLRGAGAQHVVLLSGSSVLARDLDNPISRYMLDSEAAVRASGLAWTVLRPHGFMSNTLQWVPQLQAGDLVRAPFAGVPVSMIDPADIGAVAALALRAPGHAGRVHRLTGPEPLLPADRVRILGHVLRRDLRFEGQPDAEARAEMSAAMPVAYVDAFFSFYADGNLDESEVLPTVPELLGRPARTFEEWAAAHADAFR